MTEQRQTGSETRDGFEDSPVSKPVVVPQVKLLESSTIREVHFTRDLHARAEQHTVMMLPACALEELRQRRDALPGRTEWRSEAVVPQREAALAANVGWEAAALGGTAGSEEDDEERNNDTENIGIHCSRSR
ncbi:hypothetical protein V8G54_007477 [Vigna mungo]|uniref:Uncharacterized protein n=1 Tax=Vigna mungo TaxID=3915 RepID=A0AAQ3P3D3_VIGMU